MSSPKHTNRLANEQSPYLLQHAHNPVDWFPWGEEAFAKASSEDRPIFLSIGYSSCHWCHVMERECFEDEDVATLMNQTFVNIKVDREERPDIDDLYMKVCQMMTGGGGWPLTIIMRPDRRPFYAATFIPRGNRGGTMGLLDLIPTISKVWQERRGEIDRVADQVVASLRQRSTMVTKVDEGADLAQLAFQELLSTYEDKYGGFEEAPKFPTPHKLMLLLRYGRRRGDQSALDMALWTLRNMSHGGIYDHVGFGFHRYSTDLRWFVPHFEKMLYDQAMHVMAYTEAYLLTKDDWFKRVACDTLAYVLRDLRSPEGGLYSSEDADSEGEEGRFYTFTHGEVVGSMGPEDGSIFLDACDIREEGNYREEASGRHLGRNIVHLTNDLEDLALERDISRSVLTKTLDNGFRGLYRLREERERPLRDDKVLLDWNGLMVAALAKAFRAFGDEEHIRAAVGIVDFIETRLMDPFDGLHHSYRAGRSAITVFLSDLAFYIWGLLELYMATFELRYLKRARELAKEMVHDFASPEGDFFLARENDEMLIRGKEHYDGAMPSGNSVAIYDLMILYQLTEDEDYRRLAERGLQATLPMASRVPSAHSFLAMAADLLKASAPEVVISDGGDRELAQRMLRSLNSGYLPDMALLYRKVGADDRCHELPHLDLKGTGPGLVTVHICQGNSCLAPINSWEDLEKWIKRSARSSEG